MMIEGDHSHLCEYCKERFCCPIDKHECRMEWKTSHNDHYLALSC